MDRFIESVALGRGDTESGLKSNMDRFIVFLYANFDIVCLV